MPCSKLSTLWQEQFQSCSLFAHRKDELDPDLQFHPNMSLVHLPIPFKHISMEIWLICETATEAFYEGDISEQCSGPKRQELGFEVPIDNILAIDCFIIYLELERKGLQMQKSQRSG